MTTDTISAPETPDLAGLAAYVKFQRGMLHWKQETLASMAGMSLSTVQRIERGEAVGRDALERVARAFGLDADTFTRPRVRMSEEDAAAWLKRSLSWLQDGVPVTVAPFRTEVQLRDLAEAHFSVFDSDLGPEVAEDLHDLREWINLTGFMRSSMSGFPLPRPERSFRMRELYADVFEHVAAIEKRHKAVCLVGTYIAETDNPGFSDAKIAVLALRSKDRNPAAAKIDALWAERRMSWNFITQD